MIISAINEKRLETVMKKALLFIMCALLLTACTGYNNSTSVTENGIYYHLSSNRKEAMVVSYQWDAKADNNVITIPDTLSDGTPVKKIGGFIGIGVPTSFGIDYHSDGPEFPKSRKQMSEEEVQAFYKDYANNHPDELFGHLVKLDKTDGSDAKPVSGSAVSADTAEGGSNDVSGIDAGNDSAVEREFVYKDITFTINIGKNVSSIHETISEYNILYDINSYGILQPDGTVLVYRAALYFNVDPDNKTYYAEDGVLYKTADGQPVLQPNDR